MTLRNQYVEDRKSFFFGDHIKIQTKLWHFPGLFRSLQNRRCVIFERTPGPRLALGAFGSRPKSMIAGDFSKLLSVKYLDLQY